MNSGVCAACGTLATNVYPWWFYVGLFVCLAIVVAELALINWTRWSRRVNEDRLVEGAEAVDVEVVERDLPVGAIAEAAPAPRR